MNNIELRLGDCISVMKTISNNFIDSIVTDPPAEIAKARINNIDE